MAAIQNPENSLKIKNISGQDRCDVCHQSDMFDPETQFCGRCQHIALVKAKEQPKVNAAPLPEFLVRKLSTNTAIRCHSCGEFIMSRAPTCRHCGNYVRHEEAAQAAQTEKDLINAYDLLHRCKGSASLSWEFLRWHVYGIPVTVLLTPITAVVSLGLFLRTLWLSFHCWLKLSRFKNMDPRILESRREAVVAGGKSISAFALNSTIATIVLVTGLIYLPLFWDNYAKAQREFNAKNYVEAEGLFLKAIEANPKNVEARLYYARAIWSQYVDDVNANTASNKNISDRALTEYRSVVDQTEDAKMRDEVYDEIANIYRVLKNRDEFEQWMLARAKLPNQKVENQVDAYVKLATTFARDVTDGLTTYAVKNSYPPAWTPIKNWKPEDAQKVTASAKKAVVYLDNALLLMPEHETAVPLRNELSKELTKIDLKVENDPSNPFGNFR